MANGSKSNESSLKVDNDVIEDEFEVSESQSLPSSQESLAGKTASDVTIDEEDESEYESAEEK